MSDKIEQEYFLDTSVARSLILATQLYQHYFKSQFNGKNIYISNYVRMEIKRSYLINIISFYFILRMDTINNIGDAISLWSNKFKGSELKAILQLIPQLFGTRQFNFYSKEDKEKAIAALVIYIKRFDLTLRKSFKNTNKDLTACSRAMVPLSVDLKNPTPGLKKFADEFGDIKSCRSKCQIDQFILVEYKKSIEQLIQIASQLPKNTNTRGFINIVTNLKEILKTGATACDCRRCEKIGDAIIALDAPRNMQLEYTDNSFDYLCPTINQPHYKHPSENRVVMNISIIDEP
ncbi:hypothetical protein DSM106972_093250 [Dulcicalothrix desertica PCC 7102]|uniref:Uncharacterized protein n=1 Tax=Dulcicalothrix desertica PCC 7102 TaxID=232991 RepID=A0A3S1CLA1_9CYAN|nr:hypothetical protein [Dulcicalothrix desertica]RUS94430.1 hypothetical protein DSM106972_093250 [Dulcicalothrix desertica PCC 7102]TWH61415.1 hypothetical protein CAL7102_00976 [Dulcicalothrix desertica PCC 7102]